MESQIEQRLSASLPQKLQILQQLHDLYGSFTDSLDLACRKHCCRCCTRNVTLTSLEAAGILSGLQPAEKDRLLRMIRRAVPLKRFQPQVTINEMAMRCAQGENEPEEFCDPDWWPCPLLENRACPIYPLRPFACRCLISKNDCEKTATADIDELTLTVNTIFLQVIEHLDSGGCTGNFIDVILHLSQPENMRAYSQGRLSCSTGDLVPTRRLRQLMSPPEHRSRTAPLLRQLQRLQFVPAPAGENT